MRLRSNLADIKHVVSALRHCIFWAGKWYENFVSIVIVVAVAGAVANAIAACAGAILITPFMSAPLSIHSPFHSTHDKPWHSVVM